MFFSKTNSSCVEPDELVAGERLQVFSEIPNTSGYWLIVIFLSKLKKFVRVTFNLANLTYICSVMLTEAAMMCWCDMHSIIFSYITYCSTTWSQASNTALKPLAFLYKQTLKVLDRKKSTYHHHCHIFKKYNLLNLENLIKYAHSCLMHKVPHGQAPPVLRHL